MVAVARAVKYLSGLGGIMNWKDAMEFMLAGASTIQIGTANFIDPAVTIKVAEGINDYLDRHGYKSVKEIIGALEVRPITSEYHSHLFYIKKDIHSECPFSIFIQLIYSSPSKSGRSLRVRSKDCCNSHSLILASCPDNKISGTFQPL